MQNLYYGLIMLMLLSPVTPAKAQVNIGIGLPGVNIGINLPLFPQLVLVPGYPVYYAPRVDANYFFYDGMYWVYQDDNWYASSWYNGPWGVVEPEVVPLFILRIPVRYYRQPPVYFRGWQSNAPPRWGQHWGHEWEQRRGGWDRWKRSSAPAPAPLPVYQRKFSGNRYPGVEQQHTLRSRQYQYQPRDTAVRRHFQQSAPTAAQPVRQTAPPVRSPEQQNVQHPQSDQRPPRHPAPLQQGAPANLHPQSHQQPPRHPAPHQQGAPADLHSQPPQRGGEYVQKPAPVPAAPQQRGPEVRDQRQQPGATQQQAPGAQQDHGRGGEQGQRGRGQEQRRDEDRGRGRDK